MTYLRLVPLVSLALLSAACAVPSQHAVQLAQEQKACAEMGIAPGSNGAFSTCVGNLDATMFEANDAAAR
jgi:hypothetical protein